MDKTLAGLLGALGAVAAAAPASAHPDPTLTASSYRELLAPIPNAAAALRDLEAREAAAPVETAQIELRVGPGHHHHHRVYRRPPPRYHHHHHHHHDYDRR